MYKALQTLLLCVITIGLFTSAGMPDRKFDRICKKAGYVYIPSGATIVDGKTVTIQGFYMSAGEITNEQYRVFLDSLTARGDSSKLKDAAVHSEKWRLPNSSMEAIEQQYFYHAAFDHYPVVNISQEGARLYCAWLEEQLKAKGLQVKVRLPLKSEWVMAARGGHSGNIYPWSGDHLRDSKGLYLANYKTEKSADDGGYLTTISKSYKPNDYGLFNMAGNVSEWISDTGTALGGNWWSEPEFLKIDAQPEFPMASDPTPFIGFRPVFTAVTQ